MNLIMGCLWLIVGTLLLANPYLQLNLGILRPYERNPLIGIFAILFAIYNFVRWRYLQSRARIPRASAPTPRGRRTEEYLPDFDFAKDSDAPQRESK